MKNLGILLTRLAILCLLAIFGFGIGWLISWLLRL